MLEHLERPLAFFDIEATGLNRKIDRIIDLTVIVVHPENRRITHKFLINPGMKIPKESTEIHGITDEDVKDKPVFAEVVDQIDAVFKGVDLAGYNLLYFDIPMLQEEYVRCDRRFEIDDRRIVDAQKIYHFREPRNLTAALKYYAGIEHVGAHDAEADVLATIKVFEGQLKMYEDLPRDLDALHEFCNPRDPAWVDRKGMLKLVDGDICINFGRKQGQKLKDLARTDSSFLKWIIANDFPQDTKDLVEDFLVASAQAPKKRGNQGGKGKGNQGKGGKQHRGDQKGKRHHPPLQNPVIGADDLPEIK